MPLTITFRDHMRWLGKVAKTCKIVQTIAVCAVTLSNERLLTQSNTEENTIDFLPNDSIPKPSEVDQDVKTTTLTPKGKFLRCHHCLGHLS